MNREFLLNLGRHEHYEIWCLADDTVNQPCRYLACTETLAEAQARVDQQPLVAGEEWQIVRVLTSRQLTNVMSGMTYHRPTRLDDATL